MAQRQRNKIKKLKDNDGSWKEGEVNLNPLVTGFFAGLFTTKLPEPNPQLINKVNPRVTTAMKDDLQKPYTARGGC